MNSNDLFMLWQSEIMYTAMINCKICEAIIFKKILVLYFSNIIIHLFDLWIYRAKTMFHCDKKLSIITIISRMCNNMHIIKFWKTGPPAGHLTYRTKRRSSNTSTSYWFRRGLRPHWKSVVLTRLKPALQQELLLRSTFVKQDD